MCLLLVFGSFVLRPFFFIFSHVWTGWFQWLDVKICFFFCKNKRKTSWIILQMVWSHLDIIWVQILNKTVSNGFYSMILFHSIVHFPFTILIFSYNIQSFRTVVDWIEMPVLWYIYLWIIQFIHLWHNFHSTCLHNLIERNYFHFINFYTCSTTINIFVSDSNLWLVHVFASFIWM